MRSGLHGLFGSMHKSKKTVFHVKANPAGLLSLFSALCVLIGTMNAFEFLSWSPLIYLSWLGVLGWLSATIVALRARQFLWVAASSVLIAGPLLLFGSLYYSCYVLHDCL